MRSYEEMNNRLVQYRPVRMIYDKNVGFIVWHLTTGENIEVLWIEAANPGNGQGKKLYTMMVSELEKLGQRPFHSVIIYRRGDNQQAANFARKMGFHQKMVGRHLYRGVYAVLMWIPYEELKKRLLP